MSGTTLVPPVLAAVRERHPDVALVEIDAHGDLNTPETTPSGFLGGMPFAQLLGWCFDDWRRQAGLEPPLPEDRAVLVGGRDLDPGERANVDRSQLREADDATGALAALPPNAPLYVHVDTDVLDPSLTPDAGFPAPGGWSVERMRSGAGRACRGNAAASSRSRSARARLRRSTPRASRRSCRRWADFRRERRSRRRRARRSTPAPTRLDSETSGPRLRCAGRSATRRGGGRPAGRPRGRARSARAGGRAASTPDRPARVDRVGEHEAARRPAASEDDAVGLPMRIARHRRRPAA